MISEAEHARTVILDNLDLTIQHLAALARTLPPFSVSARELTLQANVLRESRDVVAQIPLAPLQPAAA